MVELLLEKKAKAEKERDYYAEQFARADVKLEVIEELLAEAKAAETQTEEVTEQSYADSELVEETAAAN